MGADPVKVAWFYTLLDNLLRRQLNAYDEHKLNPTPDPM